MSQEEDERKDIEVVEVEAENGTTIVFESYLRRGGRHFELNLHLAKWEHPDTIADYLALFSELLREKRATVNECMEQDN